jgi:ParB-like chromosome segregation protein Spo0J
MPDRAAAASRNRRQNIVVEQVDEIVLDGMKVRVRGQDLMLDSVLLDPTNPRVASTVAVADFGSGEALQRSLRELLWMDPDVHSLYRSVLENKGLIERIIVRSNSVVAEGNCRTVVYRKLRDNFPESPLWKTIPARVLPAEITDRQIAILLGELHVGGKNKWSPFEKAGHIHKLFSQFGMTQDEIAKLLKTSKTSINHNVRAFDAMKNKYLVAFPGPGAVRKFSYFLELYKKPELRDWVSRSADALDDFVQWVGKSRIGRGEDVRELRDIVTNSRALGAFKEHGRDAALKILEQDRPELTSPLFKLMIEMTQALEQSRVDDILRVRKDKTGGARTIVRNLKESLDRFVDLCNGIE